MGAPYLIVENLTKRFGAFTALQDINLSMQAGEFVCFLGPSGCGKTTLLRAIAGLDIQTEGRVIQGGTDVSVLAPQQRDFGIVFQSYALFPNLSVARNIAFGLENAGWPRTRITARVDELLELVGLSDHADKFPARISGGQQQRVALARAIAISPGLLLLDEPLSALDARVRRHLRGEIKSLQRRLGVSTIMVTHDQEEALAMADRIVVMNMGIIEQIGTPQEIYSRPASAFVAKFIGAMNLLPAQCGSSNEPECCTVTVGSTDLVAHMHARIGPGPVQIAVRPEDIRVKDDSHHGGARNHLTLEIRRFEFMGNFYRATLTGGDLGPASLEADFSTNMVRRMRLEQGRALSVELPVDHLHVFPAEPVSG